MRISNNFSREEFACKCGCGFMSVDITLVTIAQVLRNKFNTTTIRSGCRCKAHNIDIKGHENSYHTLGMAVDLSCEKGHPHEWIALLEKLGLTLYTDIVIHKKDNFIHVELELTKIRGDRKGQNG